MVFHKSTRVLGRRFTFGDPHETDCLEGCRGRDPAMPLWHDTTRRRLRSSVFQMLAEAGYIENTRSLKLQTVHIAE